jgi:hypothetical protein
MIEARKQAYLEAMGIDVWVTRPPAPERDRLVLGPGQGSTLLVCAAPEDCASRLSGDIVRALGGDPVWAWLDPDGSPDSPRLEDAVKDRLFTHVIIFGENMADCLFGQEVPAVIASSAVSVTHPITELAVRGTAKQAFWNLARREQATYGKHASS